MAKSFKDAILAIKGAVPLEDFISKRGVELKEQGEGYIALCPFHTEKTPSFRVNSSYQTYKCFGCGKGGDIISYVMDEENCDFIEAIKILASEFSIKIEYSDSSNELETVSIDRETARRILKDTTSFFYKNFKSLPEYHPAKKEITNRGLKYEGPNVPFYGYCPGGNALITFLLNKGYTEKELKELNIAHINNETGKIFDMWPERLMFVITDTMGNPIGFSGRKIYENSYGGKYINSKDSFMFNKSKALYNYSLAKKRKPKDCEEIFILEGQFDVAAMIAEGLYNSVAASGTAFTEYHSKLVSRLAERNVFIFDGDEAGFKAAVRAYVSLKSIQKNSYAVAMPDGIDPCDYRKNNGDGSLKSYIEENKTPLIDFIIDGILKKYKNLKKDIIERNSFYKEISSIYKDSLQKEHITLFISLKINTDENLVRKEIESYIKTSKNSSSNSINSSSKDKEKTIDNIFSSEKDEEDYSRFINEMKKDKYLFSSAKALSYFIYNHKELDLNKLDNLLHQEVIDIYEQSKNLLLKNKAVYPELFSEYRKASLILSPRFRPKPSNSKVYSSKILEILEYEKKEKEINSKRALLYSKIRNSETVNEAIEALRNYG